MNISVIIATYNQPTWLQKVLWGYDNQDHKNFELIIADDGSDQDTRTLIENLKSETGLRITHVWHEDKGYRRQTILNRAIQEATYDYLLFTDGDCIPRCDFLSTHVKHAEKGYFLSGGYCKLPFETSNAISKEDIYNYNCFSIEWLEMYGKIGGSQKRKLGASPVKGKLLDLLTPAKATFNNCNVSVWKKDVLAVNGYDERMQYGGADREIGERLTNFGVKSKQIRHRAICLHLDHPRGYKTKESIEKNLAIRAATKKQQLAWTDYGIKK